EAQRRLDRALHGATEGDAALELVGNALGDELRVDFRLADFDDVEAHFARRHLLQLALELLDVRALLADDHAGARGIDADPANLRRTLDHHLRNRRLGQLVDDGFADLEIFEQQPAIVMAFGEPAAVPGPVDLQPKPDRIGFLTHLCFFLLANDNANLAERLDDPRRPATRPSGEALHRNRLADAG